VRVGLGYDYWVDALVKQTGKRRLTRGGEANLDASVGIPLLEIRGERVVNEGGHAHGVANPHYWLDPENAITVTAGIAEALVRIAPRQRETILANRALFLSQLETRRARWGQTLAPFAGTKLIAYHNSWPYFARRFRLDFIAFIEPKAGVTPSPAHLAQVIADGRKTQVRAIVHEPYEPEDASRFVAGKLAVPMVRLAISVGSVKGTNDYLALFDYNVATLCQSPGRTKPMSGPADALALLPLRGVGRVRAHARVSRRSCIAPDESSSPISRSRSCRRSGATVAFANGYAATSASGFGYALLFTVIGAALLTLTRSLAPYVSQEAFVGIVYVVATAATILVVDSAPQGRSMSRKS
jgi:ABC-type Zn uptake system ZnuABC Zn-binding protein ZnuA